MSTFWLVAIIAGTIIILGLGFYAVKLLRQLKQQTVAQQEAQAKRQALLALHDKKVLDSVVIIVRAMSEEQCDIAEGCWRLSVLLDSLKLSAELDQQFPAIFELYNKIKHMPILDARKKLAKQERMKLDYERMQVEAELSSEVQANVKLLHQYANERISVLTQ